MGKVLGGILAGVFLGALLAEFMKRTRPDLINRLGHRAKNLGETLLDGLREAYDFREIEPNSQEPGSDLPT